MGIEHMLCAPQWVLVRVRGGQCGKPLLLWLGSLGSELSALTSFSSSASQDESCELHMKSTPW